MRENWKVFAVIAMAFIAGVLTSWRSGYLWTYLILSVGLFSGLLAGVLLMRRWIRRQKQPLTERLTRRNLQEDLRVVQERLQLVIESTHDGIWDWDIAADRVYWSERAHRMAENGVEGFGDSWTILKNMLLEEDRGKLEQAIRSHLVGDLPLSVEVRTIPYVGGRSRYFLIRGKVKRDEKGNPVRMAGSISDITQSKYAEQELIYNANHDELTGVGNRRMFMSRLEHNIYRAVRRPDYLFGLIVLDIDKFKQINDSYGHTVGDQIMRQMCIRMEHCLVVHGRQPLIARIGGDEFGILLEDLRGTQDDAVRLAERLQAELVQEPYTVLEREINLTVSMGIVVNGARMENKEEMLANADTVLQKAKRAGGGRCEIFSSGMREKALQLYQLERDLRKAIDKEKLLLVYQPIINIHTGALMGFEALVRWKKDEGAVMPPADFIPMAEETGLILRMGPWILRRACEQARLWVEMGAKDLTVAVNFSARQFVDQKLAQSVRAILQQTGLPPRNLKIEITETTAMNEVERTIETLRELTAMGLQISIDDFGTGYSSLSYLKRYPIDTIKIDRSFIKDLPGDSDSVILTRTIIGMARSFQYNVVAEGVETADQLNFLKAEGCEQVQGFYFAGPLSVEEATAYLREHAA